MSDLHEYAKPLKTGQTHEAVSLQVFSAVKNGCKKGSILGKPHVELIDTNGRQWFSANPDHIRWAIENTFRGAPRTVTIMEPPELFVRNRE